MFMMIVFAWFCNVWVSYLVLLVVDTSLFRRFFTLCPSFDPYIYEGEKKKVALCVKALSNICVKNMNECLK